MIRPIRHGEASRSGRAPEYWIWAAMIRRCENPNAINYRRYGGRGIRVCAEWRQSYPAFVRDMGRRPSPAHQLDRIDNDRGYEPGNVRWTLPLDQANNRANSVILEHQGQRRTLREWARTLGLNVGTVESRLRKGWSVDRILSPEVQQSRFGAARTS